MKQVSVIYHHFPHYREPILRELADNGSFDYQFWGDIVDFHGIAAFKGDEKLVINRLKAKVTRKGFSLSKYWPAVLDPGVNAVIILGNPNIKETWLIAIVGRLIGKKILFWAHGWLKPEPPIKRALRAFYYSLAHKVLVYGNRAKELATLDGFDGRKISVIHNSLEFKNSTSVYRNLLADDIHENDPRKLFSHPSRPLIICTARLIDSCRFDLLLHAAAILKDRGCELNVLLVGDGPHRAKLEDLASALDISIVFYGACYDEKIIGSFLFDADLTVSPGKVGLTVIHSLTYGTPVITHSDFDKQMPECEAIKPGMNGAFFQYGDARNLAEVIEDWLKEARSRAAIRRECRKVVDTIWNPAHQRTEIETALNELFQEEEHEREPRHPTGRPRANARAR